MYRHDFRCGLGRIGDIFSSAISCSCRGGCRSGSTALSHENAWAKLLAELGRRVEDWRELSRRGTGFLGILVELDLTDSNLAKSEVRESSILGVCASDSTKDIGFALFENLPDCHTLDA